MSAADGSGRTDHAAELFGALVSLVPGVGPLVSRPAEHLLAAAKAERARRHSLAIHTAVRAAGAASAEDLAEAIAADPRLIPLTTRVLHAAGMSGYDDILGGLAQCLGAAVADRARVDEIDLILTTLERLSLHHVIALRAIKHQARQIPDHYLLGELLRASKPLTERMLRTALAGVVASGLVESVGTIDGGTRYRMTEYGWDVLDVIDAYRGASG